MTEKICTLCGQDKAEKWYGMRRGYRLCPPCYHTTRKRSRKIKSKITIYDMWGGS